MMTRTRLILQTIRYFWRQNFSLTLGIALSSAVITGAMIVGDSMRFSLQKIASLRLGSITHTISAGDRFLTDSLALRIEKATDNICTPLLLLTGNATSGGGQYRLPKVQILGIDQSFFNVSGNVKSIQYIPAGQALINTNLATRLHLTPGSEILLRIAQPSVIPLSAPFVSDVEQISSLTVVIAGILPDEEMGRFQLQPIQSAPFNIFLSLEYLQDALAIDGKINHILVHATKKGNTAMLEAALEQSWLPADINLKIRHNPLQNTWEATSERVFIDPVIQHALHSASLSTTFVFSYFINRLTTDRYATPYSFVSTLPDRNLPSGSIVISDWLAEDLNAKIKDTIRMDYFVIGPLKESEERSASFLVNDIVPMDGKWNDQSLMPRIPGLSDVGNCSEWKTGVPINLEAIRDKDEKYWTEFRGTPKAYISYSDAQKLWRNRFGNATLIRFPELNNSLKEIESILKNHIDIFQLGFRVNPVREQAIRAADGSVDFSQLFLGLSFFLLLASVLLTVLLFSLNTESRMSQFGTLSVLGFNNRQIKTILLIESGLVIVIGTLAGLLLAIGYNQLVFQALNNIWSAIVRTEMLVIHIRTATLLIGMAVSAFISFLSIYFSLKRLLKQQAHALQTGTIRNTSFWRHRLKRIIMSISGLAAIFLTIWGYQQGVFQHSDFFFLAGGLSLIALLLLIHDRLTHPSVLPEAIPLTTSRFVRQNITRNYNRSFLVIALFAIGAFIILSTGSNQRDAFSLANEKDSGTGGFLFFAESTVPVLHNLNDPAVRFEAGLESEYPIVQLRRVAGDDASCLNLNRVTAPGIWGVHPDAFAGRFRFVTRTKELDEVHPWLSLKQPLEEAVLPAVADQTVIQWGLGIRVGDTLEYLDESGRPLKLKLIGGLANSIFQGNVLIDEELFLTHFPSNSGSYVFLVDGDPGMDTIIRNELESSFRDYGWAMQRAAERLASFNSVENTYLSIFMLLGGLGLIIGTIGLAIVLARNLLDRRRELDIMRALGFSRQLIIKIITLEHFYLLLTGVGTGIVSSIVAGLSSWLNPNLDLSLWSVLLFTGVLFLSGLGWIILATYMMIRNIQLPEASD